MGKYFGTDGVRGKANQELTPELAFKLGRAGGYVLTQHAQLDEDQPARVIVGRDTRISGELLEAALTAGLLSVGIEVMQCGVVTTPAIAYLTVNQGATAGVVISASHNPAEDNGIKFFGSDGFKLSDAQEEEIEALIDGEDSLPRPAALGLGTTDDFPEGANKYIQYLQTTVSEDLSGIRVCIDAANGASSPLVNQLFADLETDFMTMGDRPDGININEGVGSTHPEKLQKMVIENEADIGLAFDGDGDRVIAVDEKGQLVDGDKIMYIIGKQMKQKGQLAKDTIVATVMSNLGFHKAANAQEIETVTTKVGDRYVVEEMLAQGYNLGGEQSGHIIMLDYNSTGDGLLTGVQLLAVMKETGKSLSELTAEVPSFPQKLVNVKVNNKETIQTHPDVQAIIAEVESELKEDGRVLVRPSGTEPILRVMAEAPTEDKVAECVARIVEVVERVSQTED